jgi:hypothetical protein
MWPWRSSGITALTSEQVSTSRPNSHPLLAPNAGPVRLFGHHRHDAEPATPEWQRDRLASPAHVIPWSKGQVSVNELGRRMRSSALRLTKSAS